MSIRPSDALGSALLRIALGAMYIAHALLKLIAFTLPGTARFFAEHGIPGMLAYPVFAAELAGGVLLIVGLYARQVALLLIPVLIGAGFVHLPNGWVFNAPGGGWEYPAFLIVVSIAVWLQDDRAWALRPSSRWTPRAAVASEGRP